MTSIPFPYLVGKRHDASPSLGGDSQRNHWLQKNRMADDVNTLPHLVSKRHGLSPSLVGDAQRDH